MHLYANVISLKERNVHAGDQGERGGRGGEHRERGVAGEEEGVMPSVVV